MGPESQHLIELLSKVDGFIYPNDLDLHWGVLIVMYPYITGLVAGAIGNKIYATCGHKGPPLVVLSSLEQYNPVVTAVAAKSELPIQQQQSFLYQNYPNPFNSTTQIRYSLNKPYFVRLEIYNVRGERIESAINEFKNVGNYSLILNTSQFSSGTYFYHLYLDGQGSESRKMLYIK